MKPLSILKIFMTSLEKYSLRLNFAMFFVFLSMDDHQVISSKAGTQGPWGFTIPKFSQNFYFPPLVALKP